MTCQMNNDVHIELPSRIVNHLYFFYRYEYFSVQFYGECWSGPDAGKTFARDGESDKCYQGIGLESTNAVYRIENLPGRFGSS